MKLLIIRPQPGADATAARASASGHEPVLMPLFAAKPLAWEIPAGKKYDGILITSANAIRHAGEKLSMLTHLPVYAVGQNSADAAAGAGFAVKYTGLGGIEQLLNQIDARSILWLSGEDRTLFRMPQHQEIDCCIVYKSASLSLPDNFTHTVLNADYVLLHSARAARHFASAAHDLAIDKKQIAIGALSEKIAMAAGSGWRDVRIAALPSDLELLSQL